MNLRVLLGAVLAGLILIGSGGTGARADLGSPAGDVQTLQAVEILTSNAIQPEGTPAADSEHSSSEDADPDSDQDPVVKVRPGGFLSTAGPTREPVARQTARYLPGRPPAPPPKPRGAAKNIATQIASVGAESAGSEFPPRNIAANHGAQTFLSSISAPLSVAKAQAFAGDDGRVAASCPPLCGQPWVRLCAELIRTEPDSVDIAFEQARGVICRFEL